jgi:hypothetical protein
MSFSTLLEKLAANSGLTPAETQSLVLEARRLEDAASLLNKIIKPGSSILVIDGLIADHAEIRSATAGGGDITIDETGIWMENQEADFGFRDTNGNIGNIYIASNLQNFLNFVNTIVGAGHLFTTELTNEANQISIQEDTSQTDRILVQIYNSTQGARLNIGTGKIDLRAEGTGGGSTFMRMIETTNTPPNPSASADAYHLYMKGDKFIIQFNDGGTVRYKYLDLTGTGVTWVHTTTAP